MADIVFPATIRAPSYPWEEKWENPVLTSPFENGSVQSRPKYTRLRDTYIMQWKGLPQEELDILRDFWKTAVLGGSQIFLFTKPANGNTPAKQVRMRFADEIKTVRTLPGYWDVTCTMQEA